MRVMGASGLPRKYAPSSVRPLAIIFASSAAASAAAGDGSAVAAGVVVGRDVGCWGAAAVFCATAVAAAGDGVAGVDVVGETAVSPPQPASKRRRSVSRNRRFIDKHIPEGRFFLWRDYSHYMAPKLLHNNYKTDYGSRFTADGCGFRPTCTAIVPNMNILYCTSTKPVSRIMAASDSGD